MIEAFLQGMSPQERLIALFMVLIFIVLVLGGIKKFLLVLMYGYPKPESEAPMPCPHENNLTKLCLRNPRDRCQTTEHCENAVVNNDY